MDIKNNPQKMQENSPKWASNPLPALLRRHWRWVLVAVAAILVITAGSVWLAAQGDSTRQIGPNTADPAYIVVNTPTAVTFTSVIADSNLKKHDPKKVLLIRTDAAGTPVDILGRMNDRGKKADAGKNDHTYTIQATLNEPTVGQVPFRIAAKFKATLTGGKDSDGDDDWDGDLAALKVLKDKNQKRDRLTRLLRRIDRYTLSDAVQTTVDPFKLPPDPGEAGKQTLAGIDLDQDGVRDDVQRYIVLGHVNSQRTRSSLLQYGRSLQIPLVSVTSAPVQAATNQVAGIRCVAYVLGATAANNETNIVLSRMLNTPERLRAYAMLQDAVRTGAIPPARQSELKSFCAFDPDTMKD